MTTMRRPSVRPRSICAGMLMEKYGIDIRKPENWARIKEHEAAIIEKDGYGEIPRHPGR